jgi:hypothetical protein
MLHVKGSTAHLLFTERCSSVLEFFVIQYEAWTDTEPYITVITKLKWPKRSFLEKTIHYILQSNGWHDNDLNPLSPAKSDEPLVKVANHILKLKDESLYPVQHGYDSLHCVLGTLYLSSPHMMCELWRHSGYIDQLGIKELFRPFPHLIGNAVAACHHITQFHRTPTRNSQCTEVLINFSHHLQNDPILWGCAFWWRDKLPSCLSNLEHLCFLSPCSVTFLLLHFQGLQLKVCWHSPSFVTKSCLFPVV